MARANLPKQTLGKSVAKVPQVALSQAVAEALKQAQRERGGKSIAPFFDGREGKEVAESTISRWIGDPWRMSILYTEPLVRLQPAFGVYLFRSMPVWMGTDAEVVVKLSPGAREEYIRLMEERTLDAVYGHNRMGERYA